MQLIASSIVRKLRPYFDGLLQEDESSGVMFLKDQELGDRASCCTTGEVACLYVLDSVLHGGNGLEIAEKLIQDVRARQLPQGAFVSPYNIKHGEAGTVDIAEIGAVADSLYHVHKATGSQAAKESLIAAADYLLTQIALENPGAVYKNPNAKQHDVLNGDVYAAHTWGRAYELTGSSIYLDKARSVITHIADRFGKHSDGWWPYTEQWDGSLGIGNSTAYQATIIGFADTVVPLLPETLRASWNGIAEAALHSLLRAVKEGPNDHNEAPYWARDWSNVWEIYLAFSRFPDWPEPHKVVSSCLEEVDAQLNVIGLERFRPANRHDKPDRTPVLTTFRKAATFAGVFSYMILERK